ncbi:putative transposase OrfB [Phaeobacter italicus]|nr:putative transposase OrfB [Phaeobacter italicus]SFH64034.1 Integrase core domain-containing protein [Phaeobacter italicus]
MGSSRSALSCRLHYEHLAKRADPARLSDRARRDAALRPEIRRVFEENWRVYGVRKVWRQLQREGFDVARCTVARLMKSMGIRGIIRGKPHKTTVPDKKAPCPLDKVNRQFRVPAPNMLWVSDFTYVATWRGFAYVAFVIDAYARKIVGWRVSTSAHAGFVLPSRQHAAHAPAGQWMLWSKLFTSGGRQRRWGLFTTPTAAANTCRSNTQNGWAKPVSSPLSAALETVTSSSRSAQRIK